MYIISFSLKHLANTYFVAIGNSKEKRYFTFVLDAIWNKYHILLSVTFKRNIGNFKFKSNPMLLIEQNVCVILCISSERCHFIFVFDIFTVFYFLFNDRVMAYHQPDMFHLWV